jgi:hypothetical protein
MPPAAVAVALKMLPAFAITISAGVKSILLWIAGDVVAFSTATSQRPDRK